jgi:hypothetical protein
LREKRKPDAVKAPGRFLDLEPKCQVSDYFLFGAAAFFAAATGFALAAVVVIAGFAASAVGVTETGVAAPVVLAGSGSVIGVTSDVGFGSGFVTVEET